MSLSVKKKSDDTHAENHSARKKIKLIKLKPGFIYQKLMTNHVYNKIELS